jgi:hypothetical protein
LADSPVRFAGTLTLAASPPIGNAGVTFPYNFESPHSKYTVVGARFGFAVPFNIAELSVNWEAAPVSTVGEVGGVGIVVKEMSLLRDVSEPLTATRR